MIKLYCNDNEKILKELDDCSIDGCLTDPPYGLKFLNNDWTQQMPKFSIWEELYRVLKPGSFLIVFSATRLDCLSKMVVNIEKAGFNISFSPIYWVYASGYPKTVEVSKKLRKNNIDEDICDYYQGWYSGFQLKPAVEVIIVAQKPILENTYIEHAKNAYQNKDIISGCTNMTDCRIPVDNDDIYNDRGVVLPGKKSDIIFTKAKTHEEKYIKYNANKNGRYPANLLVSDKILDNKHSKSTIYNKKYNDVDFISKCFDLDKWWDERLKILPLNVKNSFPFLIIQKPNKKEKNENLMNKNIHITVKPLKLIVYLLTMFFRKNDLCIDPFMGSGVVGIGCKLKGISFYGIENDKRYFEISEVKINKTKNIISDFF